MKIKNVRKFKYIVIIIVLIMLISLSACFDADEIDDMVYIVGVGVDKGVADKWRLTLQFENLKEASGAGGGSSGSEAKQEEGKDKEKDKQEEPKDKVEDQGNYSYVTIDAPTFFTGIDMLNSSISRKISFLHIQFIVFSQELAEEGILGEFLAPIVRFREIRDTAQVYITKGKALDVIKANKPFIGKALVKDHQIWMMQSKITGYFPDTSIHDFYNSLKTNSRFPIAAIISANDMKSFQEEGEPYNDGFKLGGEYYSGEIPRLGQNQIELWGTAIFDGDKMVGELNGHETRLLLMLRGEFERGFITFYDPLKPELAIPLDFTEREKPKVKISFKNNKPVIEVFLKLDADILAIQSNIFYENPSMKELLENFSISFLEKDMATLIQKCLDAGVDPFMFGEFSAKEFLTIQELESYNWNNNFKEATVLLDLSVIIRRTGTFLRSSKIIGPEGQPE